MSEPTPRTPGGDILRPEQMPESYKILSEREGWKGKYFFLNVRARSRTIGEAVIVKARDDGTYLCTNSECINSRKAVWSPGCDETRVCRHATFVAQQDKWGSPAPHDATPTPHQDSDFPHGAPEPNDEPTDELDERTEYKPPF